MRIPRLLHLALLLPFVIACRGESPASTSATPAAPPSEASAASVPAAATGTPAPGTAVPAPEMAPAPAGVLASTDGETPNVTLDVTQLKRDRGNTITLRFTVKNGSSEPLVFASNWMGDHQIGSDYRAVGGIHLLDPVNNQKYFVVRDSERTCVCSRDVQDLAPGQSVNLWAKFPAPPAGVEAVTVVVPHFIPMDDVRIQG